MAMEAEELLRPLTYQDLDDYDDPLMRYEIIGGELNVSPAASPDHGQMVLALYDALKAVIKDGNLGRLWVAPVDVELSAHNVVQPDLLFIERDRLGMVGATIKGGPDLAIEVVSPSSRVRDYVTKRVLYETAGVSEYWIVDPMKRVIEILVLKDGRYTSLNHENGVAQSVVVPGVEVEIARLFDEFTV